MFDEKNLIDWTDGIATWNEETEKAINEKNETLADELSKLYKQHFTEYRKKYGRLPHPSSCDGPKYDPETVMEVLNFYREYYDVFKNVWGDWMEIEPLGKIEYDPNDYDSTARAAQELVEKVQDLDYKRYCYRNYCVEVEL